MKRKVSITLEDGLFGELEGLIDGMRIRNLSQSIEFLIKKSLSERRTAVILAGGTEESIRVEGILKPLIRVDKKTVIEHIIDSLRAYKFNDIYVVGRKGTLSEVFGRVGDGSAYGVTLNYIEELEEKQGGTANTLKLLKGRISRSFLCIYCDIIFDYDLEKLWNFHVKNGEVATLVLKTSKTPIKYGVVQMEGNNIVNFVEKPKKTASYLVYTGIFIANPAIFEMVGSSLEYNLFPQLAKKRELSGYICSGRSEHVHSLR